MPRRWWFFGFLHRISVPRSLPWRPRDAMVHPSIVSHAGSTSLPASSLTDSVTHPTQAQDIKTH